MWQYCYYIHSSIRNKNSVINERGRNLNTVCQWALRTLLRSLKIFWGDFQAWGSLAAILGTWELSNLHRFSSLSQKLHDMLPFFLRLCLPFTFLHISCTSQQSWHVRSCCLVKKQATTAHQDLTAFNTSICNIRTIKGTSTLHSLVLKFAPWSGDYSHGELSTIPWSRSSCLWEYCTPYIRMYCSILS